MVVTIPAAISSRFSMALLCDRWLVALSAMPNRYQEATGKSHSVSISMPLCASTAIFLRVRPYSEKLSASPSAISGSDPNFHSCTSTPAVASNTASHCIRRKRSPRNSMPITTLSKGLMK